MRPERIDLRVTLEEKLKWHFAAQADGVKLAAWISAQCNKALDRYVVTRVDSKKPYKPCYFDVP